VSIDSHAEDDDLFWRMVIGSSHGLIRGFGFIVKWRNVMIACLWDFIMII
jgi:hypothetical protein